MWRAGLLIGLIPWLAFAAPRPNLLHVSYDATREMFAEYNAYFVNRYEREHGVRPRVQMSHGGSGKQARSVMDGLPADVVSLALAFDVDAIAARGKIATNWRNALPQQASPFYSTVVFLVRKQNPKKIHDWGDLLRRDITILTPNPKTSGAARWSYLAAWAYTQHAYTNNIAAQQKFMCALLKQVPVFDTGARAATTNFVRRNKGDVLITPPSVCAPNLLWRALPMAMRILLW
jgi:sulfate/thiosulfate transport system substrate-binding protein